MQPQAGMAMQRLIHTPLGRAIAQVLIVWLVLQPLWEVSRSSARADAPLQAPVVWALALVRLGTAHAASVPIDADGDRQRFIIPG